MGCTQEKNEWNPIFEVTGFDYFNTELEQSLALINGAYSDAKQNDLQSVEEKLSQAKNRVLGIKDYYVPLTMVRQNVYDAERYYKLKDITKSVTLLQDSKSIIASLDITTKNKVFDQVISGLNSMMNDVITSFDEGSESNSYDKMKVLGEHVNLMLFRGDLVLSGIEFDK